MLSVNAIVSLFNPSQNYVDIVDIHNIPDRKHFFYRDNDEAECEMSVFDDGICLYRKAADHSLELHLRSDKYARISSEEGIIKIDVKVVDFQNNSDILVMRYLIDDEERTIKLEYY